MILQKTLREDMTEVQTSKYTQTPADKTHNMYRLRKSDYQNLLRNTIATTFKKQIKLWNKNKQRRYQVHKTGICIRQD